MSSPNVVLAYSRYILIVTRVQANGSELGLRILMIHKHVSDTHKEYEKIQSCSLTPFAARKMHPKEHRQSLLLCKEMTLLSFRQVCIQSSLSEALVGI